MEVGDLVIFGSHKRMIQNLQNLDGRIGKLLNENIRSTSGGILEHPSPWREMRQLCNIACQGRWKMGKVWQ